MYTHCIYQNERFLKLITIAKICTQNGFIRVNSELYKERKTNKFDLPFMTKFKHNINNPIPILDNMVSSFSDYHK